MFVDIIFERTGKSMKRTNVIFIGCFVFLMMAYGAAAFASPEAVCVPWQPSKEVVPHFTYSGAEITLKGIARGDAVEFRWDFGDGLSTGWC